MTARKRQRRPAVRVSAAVLVLTLLSPPALCCHGTAGLFPVPPARAAHTHSHDAPAAHPNHGPAGMPDPCPPWLDAAAAVPAGGGFFVPASPPEPAPLRPMAGHRAWGVTLVAVRRPSRSPPGARAVPIYLRFSRLLA